MLAQRDTVFLLIRSRLGACVVPILLATGLLCCAASGPDAPPVPSDPEARAERIEVLRRSIDQDHATLENLVTTPPQDTDTRSSLLHQDPEIRAIAERLGAHKNELAQLEQLQQEEAP